MRIMSLNANGIRAAARKGFFDWLPLQNVDFVCIQETKAQLHQLADEVFHPSGYHCHYHDAEKKGYSGVALFSRHAPDQVIHGIGWSDFDCEGRWLQVDVGPLSVVSLYLPSGTSKQERQAFKVECMDYFAPKLKELAAAGRDVVICGDWNIAHKEIDLKNWKANQKNSGFLPEERAFMDEVFGPLGWADAFRQVDPNPDRYTWWSNRGRAWDNNVGWRIDYQVITRALASRVVGADIYKENRFSDHAPLIIEYDYPIER
jgi:exodeoxyribonuclease III